MSIISDNSTGRGDAVTLPSSLCPSSPSKPKPASLLVDTTNTAPAVQLKDQGILVQGVPEESQVSGRDEQTKRFEELINKGQYEEIAELGKEMNDEELLKCLCQAVTILDHFKGLYEYLKQRNMVPGFLAHGEMVLVRKVIVETDLLETDRISVSVTVSTMQLPCHSTKTAMSVLQVFLKPQKKDPTGRTSSTCLWEVSLKDTLLRRTACHSSDFLPFTEKCSTKSIPPFSKLFAKRLVLKLRYQLDNPGSQKLLIDLVGQPSLLTPAAYAGGFLYRAGDANRVNFIKYGYKEAIEEGLKEEYIFGGGDLWKVMVRKYPTQFSGAYPSTDEARRIALKNFKPTKQDREEEWARKNAPILLKHLETLVTKLPLYRDLLLIVAGYAITWVVV